VTPLREVDVPRVSSHAASVVEADRKIAGVAVDSSSTSQSGERCGGALRSGEILAEVERAQFGRWHVDLIRESATM